MIDAEARAKFDELVGAIRNGTVCIIDGTYKEEKRAIMCMVFLDPKTGDYLMYPRAVILLEADETDLRGVDGEELGI